MFKDDLRRRVMDQVQSLGLRGFRRFLTAEILGKAAEPFGGLLTGPLSFGCLTWLGVCCALETTKNFADVLVLTMKLLNDAPADWTGALLPQAGRGKRAVAKRGIRGKSKHDPRRGGRASVSEEAFVKARKRMPWEYWTTLIVLLADRFQQEHAAAVHWKRFRLLALDGTLINLPCQKSLRDYFGMARNQRGGQQPQARMLLLQFPLTRVPYRFALAPKSCAEKTLAASLLADVRGHDLVLMDRGFWSYGLFCQIHAQQAFFAIRQIQQADLSVIRRLGPADTLVRYAPKDKQWRRKGLPESLVLRRIVYQIPGFRQSAVITNATDAAEISRQEWVGLATDGAAQPVLDKTLYHHRWSIETTFSELKIHQGLNRLRGRTPEAIFYEVASHLLLYLMVRWLMVQAAEQQTLEPIRLSFAEALREVRDLIPLLILSPLPHVKHVLLPHLLKRIAIHTVPHRPGRHYDRPNDTKTRNLGNGRKQQPAKLAA